MLTIIKKESTSNANVLEIRGLSTDEKPTENISNGSMFFEINTGNIYLYNEEGKQWAKISSSGGGSANLQSKEVTITENTITNINPDAGYDGLSSVKVTTNVSGGGKYAPSFISFAEFEGTSLANELDNLDTSNCTSMKNMFSNCSNLTSLDLSKLDTSNCTNMAGMFSNFSASNVDFSVLDTSNVTDMNGMFGEASVSSLDLSDWDTSKVEDMGGMFSYTTSLESVDLSGWDTSSCLNFASMFSMTSGMATIDLSSFTANQTGGINVDGMFETETSKTIDMSNFDFSKVDTQSLPNLCGWDGYISAPITLYVKDQTQVNLVKRYIPSSDLTVLVKGA